MKAQTDYKKELVSAVNKLQGRYALWEIWSDFVSLSAICISNILDFRKEREDEYLRIKSRYSEEEMGTFAGMLEITDRALTENPNQDFLGEVYMQLNLGSHWHGQFFTPYNVCDMMARMLNVGDVGELAEKPYITAGDPCCGAGALLIAAANAAREELERSYPERNWYDSILLAGQDIDPIAVKMAYIQLSVLGCAAYFKIGNSLTEPMAEDDQVKDYWFTPVFAGWNLRDRTACSISKGPEA